MGTGRIATAPPALDAHVRDSKDTIGPVLAFTANDWHAFTEAAKTGQFDHR